MGLAAAPGAATAGAAAAPVSAGVPAAGDSPGMAPFRLTRGPSPAQAKRFFSSTPPTPTATYLPIAGPSGAVKTGPTYLLHRV